MDQDPAARPEADATTGPAVVVHGLAQLRLALDAAGRLGCPTLLAVSSADAACHMGPAWWLALVRLGAAAAPGPALHDLLDCSDAAGRALQALRLGGRGLILAADCPQRAAVLERALPLGARVLERRPAALDLGLRGAERRLEAWLTGGRSGDKAGSVG